MTRRFSQLLGNPVHAGPPSDLVQLRRRFKRRVVGQHFFFQPDAADFDGTNDYLTRGADLTGNADGKKGTISVWIKHTGTVGGTERVIMSGSLFFDFNLNVAGSAFRWQVIGVNPSTVLAMLSNTVIAGGVWHHCLMSWDLSQTKGHLWVNDGEDLAGSGTFVDDVVGYSTSSTDYAIGATTIGSTKLEGEMAELYFNNRDYLDLTITSNRRKFITPDLKPVYLGEAGQRPTGSKPIIYLSGDSTAFLTNKGPGGGFTENGALADAVFTPGT